MTRCFILIITALQFFLVSCSKMNDLHKKYLDEGETIYLNKLKSFSSLAGKNRVRFTYVNVDPKVSKIILYWNTRADSILIDIPENTLNDTLSYDLTGLAENAYVFEAVTTDKEFRYFSMPVEASARSYGMQFQNSLRQRLINLQGTAISNNNLTLKLYLAPRYTIFTEFQFTGVSEESKIARVPGRTIDTLIRDVKKPVFYRTAFLPESNCVDTFYTSLEQLQLP